MLLIDETVAYIESGECRRKFLLNYFGQDYVDDSCKEGKMCDNCKNPKEQKNVTSDVVLSLKIISSCIESHYLAHIANIAMGNKTDGINSYKHHLLPEFGQGKNGGDLYWTSVLRKCIIENLIYREIEEYGTLKMTDKGRAFIINPYEINISLNHDYESEGDVVLASNNHSTVDRDLYNILLDIRKIEAKKVNKPPYVLIQAPSLEEMCIKYPISQDEFTEITGITKAMASKYWEVFCKVIASYVEENDILRPYDFTVRSVINKSSDKVKIISSIDKKISLDTIAKELGMNFSSLVDELESIVYTGTKLNINYYLKDILDEELIVEMLDFFQTNETGDIKECFEAFVDDDLPDDDIRAVRLQFISNNII
jgi:ATP-dependent DNA helicase RecQ